MTFKPDFSNSGRRPRIRCRRCHKNGKCECQIAGKGPSGTMRPVGPVTPFGPTGPA